MAVKSVSVGKMKFPLDRRYYIRRGAHVWLLPDSDGTVKLGMDEFLAQNAGFLNYIQLDKLNSVKKGASVGSFESAKFVSRIYSPVGGRVVGINDEIVKNPRRINRDPYKSWIISIKPENLERDLLSKDLLSDAADIKEWIKEELKKSETMAQSDECTKENASRAKKGKKSR